MLRRELGATNESSGSLNRGYGERSTSLEGELAGLVGKRWI